MDIKEKIAVMQAFADGKKIEICLINADPIKKWFVCYDPTWNWDSFDYRIKPEPKLRPYTFDELQDEMAKGKFAVKLKGQKRILTILQVLDDVKEIYKIKLSDWMESSYELLMEHYQWLDGSPCGVIEEE